MTVVDLTDTDRPIGERVFLVSGLEEVAALSADGGVEVDLQHHDVRVVEDLVGLLSMEGMERGE